jgi:hypothetical protein
MYVLSNSNSSFNFERDVNFGVRWYNTVRFILSPVLWLDGVGQVQGCLSFAVGHGAGGLVAPGLDSVDCRYVVGLVDCIGGIVGKRNRDPVPVRTKGRK